MQTVPKIYAYAENDLAIDDDVDNDIDVDNDADADNNADFDAGIGYSYSYLFLPSMDSFMTGMLSPVSNDSSTMQEPRTRRRSQGTMS